MFNYKANVETKPTLQAHVYNCNLKQNTLHEFFFPLTGDYTSKQKTRKKLSQGCYLVVTFSFMIFCPSPVLGLFKFFLKEFRISFYLFL